jgi:dihydroorotase
LAPLEDLAKKGAVAFSDDGDPLEDGELMRQALLLARRVNRPVFPHEEVKRLTAGGCMHKGEVSARLGVKGMPAAGEEEMIARDIDLVRQTGGPLHIAHVSTAGSVELVRRAKVEGLPVTCEVLPHHFILTDAEVAAQGAMAKMSPPLRTATDVEAMLLGLQDGSIDLIATDHAPHTQEEKQLPLEEAPFGVVGLETALGLTLNYLVEPGILDLPTAIAKWTWAPARILRLGGGRLSPGDPGDLTLIDLTTYWRVDASRFHSKSRNTPFDGYVLKGRAAATIIGGEMVYSA